MQIGKMWKKKKELLKARNLYGDYYKKSLHEINDLLQYYVDQNQAIAVWGGGLKGTAFLDLYDPNRKYIACVFDMNKEKWQTLAPTGHFITSCEDAQYQAIEVIMIMNSNYETEIAGRLIEKGKQVILINIDSIILGAMSVEEVIKFYGKKL